MTTIATIHYLMEWFKSPRGVVMKKIITGDKIDYVSHIPNTGQKLKVSKIGGEIVEVVHLKDGVCTVYIPEYEGDEWTPMEIDASDEFF